MNKFIAEIEWKSRKYWPVKKQVKIRTIFTDQAEAQEWMDSVVSKMDVHIFRPIVTKTLVEQATEGLSDD